MTDANGTNGLAFSFGELEYQCTLMDSAWLEDDEGITDVCLGPVGEGRSGGGRLDGDFLQRVTERVGGEQ